MKLFVFFSQLLRVGFFDVNANYAQGLSLMVLFIFGFWLTVDFILGDVNLLQVLGVTPVAREVRQLMEDFDAEQVYYCTQLSVLSGNDVVDVD